LKAISEIVINNKSERNFKIEKMISKFELDAVKNTKAKHLSGGQRKKVSIAMSLMSDPKIILMDEPFQGLDIMSTRDLQETIVNLQTENNNRSCIISDHAARDLLAISDRAIILANKKIIAQGTPSELINNTNAKNLYFGEAFKIN
jgi:lipopolysaccharide export system ATP-binding protein